jgi:hypothetical protein
MPNYAIRDYHAADEPSWLGAKYGFGEVWSYFVSRDGRVL